MQTPTLPALADQVRTLVELGVHDLAGVSEAELHAAAARAAEAERAGDGGSLLVVHRDRVSASVLVPLLRRLGKPGFVVSDLLDVDAFAPIDAVALPPGPVYLVYGPDRGDQLANRSPDEALPLITAARMCSGGRQTAVRAVGPFHAAVGASSCRTWCTPAPCRR